MFGPGIDLAGFTSFPDLFRALAAGKHTAAVVPIENALYGSLHQNYDALVELAPGIAAETFVRVELCLVARKKSPVKRGARVLVHPVAQEQCRDFFAKHGLAAVTAADTAGSVRELLAGADAEYAVASALAAKLYRGHVLVRGIEDDPNNFTRMLAIGPAALHALKKARAPKGYKTSLAFTLPNTPGALFKALGCFSLRDIDLSKLESRPMRGRPFEYLFYVDALEAADAPNMRHALSHLSELAEKIWLLGSYPRAK